MSRAMKGKFSETPHFPYETLRVVSAVDDSALSLAALKDGLPNGVVTKLNSAVIIFKGSDAENEVFNWTLYGARNSGPAEKIATGTAILGDVPTGVTGEYYANDITITSYWGGDVIESDGGNISGTISKLMLDLFGIDEIQMILSSSTSATMGCDVSWV